MAETSINLRKLEWQNFLVFIVIAAGISITYMMYWESFHSRLLPALGLSQKLGDTLGTLFILAFSFGAALGLAAAVGGGGKKIELF